jgi:hypothetical protein
MVDITSRLGDIENRVAKGEYITINRGRQYGKTTTLYHLAQRLSKDYVVFSISFEALGESEFRTKDSLAFAFWEQVQMAFEYVNINHLENDVKNTISNIVAQYAEKREIPFATFEKSITDVCAKNAKPIVLIIDEVDNASNYESFIEMLRMLRNKYLKRMQVPTFQSVILAGVYDIKNLKLKVRPDSDHQYNSPWNIAVAFKERMSFSKEQIAQMLGDYENDHHTGMDINGIASLIEDYTSGYPFLVSKICLTIDEEKLGWTTEGVIEAVKILLVEKNTFFDDLNKKLDDFPELESLLKDILYYGKPCPFNLDIKVIDIAQMFNYIANNNGYVKISNRIIETRLYNKFMAVDVRGKMFDAGEIEKSQFIENGSLKMDLILERFAFHFNQIYGKQTKEFKEEEARRYFMLYVRPIINGTGNYYIEAQTRDRSRTDMVIDYLGKQYIIEMKIWRGNSYNERGEQQLAEYLDFYNITKGYLLSFCFNKKKIPAAKTIKIGDREIVEVVV